MDDRIRRHPPVVGRDRASLRLLDRRLPRTAGERQAARVHAQPRGQRPRCRCRLRPTRLHARDALRHRSLLLLVHPAVRSCLDLDCGTRHRRRFERVASGDRDRADSGLICHSGPSHAAANRGGAVDCAGGEGDGLGAVPWGRAEGCCGHRAVGHPRWLRADSRTTQGRCRVEDSRLLHVQARDSERQLRRVQFRQFTEPAQSRPGRVGQATRVAGTTGCRSRRRTRPPYRRPSSF